MADGWRLQWLAGTAAVMAGNVLSAGLGFLLLVLLSRTLAPGDLGIVSPIVSFLDVSHIAIETLFGAGTISVAARYLNVDPRRADMAFKLAFWMRVGTALCFILPALALAPLLTGLLFGGPYWVGELRLTLLGIAGVAVYTSLTSVLQTRQQFLRLALVAQFKNGVRVLGLLGLIALGAVTVSATVEVYALAALASAGLTLLSVSLRFALQPGVDRRVLTELVAVNKWMLLVMFANFGGRIDIFMLSGMSTPEQVGLYTVAFQLCLAVTVLGQAMVTTLFPRVAAFKAPEQMRAYLRTCLRLMPLALVPLAAAFWLSDWAIPWLLGERYAAAVPVFNIVIISSVITLVSNPQVMLLFTLDRVNVMALGTLAQVLLRIALNVVLIPRFGAVGAAYADVTGRALPTVAMLAVTYWLVHRDRPAPETADGPNAR